MGVLRVAPVVTAAVLLAAACGGGSDNERPVAAEETPLETPQPETPQPETTQPETTQPETTQPETTQPETTQPGGEFSQYVGPRAIDTPTDGAFADPLIDLSLVLSGGPPPDGIPAIDAPNYSTVESAGFLQPTEPILVLEINGDVRGFPVQILTWHEIVNTEVGGVPVSVTFCPLCNSATAFPRELSDGTIADFGTSGLLFNSSLLMYDRQTGSLWTHFDGRAVIGAAIGEELERIPVQTVSWESFSERHPDALVLNRNTGVQKPYGQNPYGGYDSTATSPFLFVGDTDERLAAKTRVVAVRGEETVVVVTEDLADVAVVHTELDGRPIVVFHLPGTSSALDSRLIFEGRDVGATGVFASLVGDDILTFTSHPDGTFRDDQTDSTWDIFGTATAGPMAGAELDDVEHLDTFWFAIAAFVPEARLISVG